MRPHALVKDLHLRTEIDAGGMMPTPVSVVVLNFNRREELKITLTSILAQSHRTLEVIVADNASSDGSVQMVRNEFPGVRILALPQNIGSRARRKAAEQATGRYVMMYDDDSGPATRDDMSQLAFFFDRRPEISAVCTAIYRTRSGYFETAGWEHFGVGGDAENGYEGLFVHGSGTAYRRQDLLASGAFDNELFWGDEEFDAALAIAARGFRIVYLPSIVTNHRASLINRSKQRYFRGAVRNHILTFHRYFDRAEAFEYSAKEVFYQTALARLSFPYVWLGFWDAVRILTNGPMKEPRHLPESTRAYLREVRERRYPGVGAWMKLQVAARRSRENRT
jgi:GT2 family glycosyltransferase